VANYQNPYEHLLLEQLRSGSKEAFSIIFAKYYNDLVSFSSSITRDTDVAEEIVQNTFVKFWEGREALAISTSLKSYLLKTVQNGSIDWLRHLKIRSYYANDLLEKPEIFENNTEQYILWSELQNHLEDALSTLPPDVAQTFRMSRFDGLKYAEIAVKLGVSVRTIEVRVSKALEILREHLKDFLFVIILLFSGKG
jgi:RNA polymerase sigma-70 factor, ECF subfamily